MQLLIFIIAYPFIWVISILPFRVFYLLSDVLYLLTYYVIGYRKKTVRTNIALALPHLSAEPDTTLNRKKIISTLMRHVYGNDKNHDHFIRRNEQKIRSYKSRSHQRI